MRDPTLHWNERASDHRDVGISICQCRAAAHKQRLIAITGGPGAGKTAVLELARRHFCRHVRVLPEAATLLLAGGFPRYGTEPAVKALQRAILAVQMELERAIACDLSVALSLCDRGTIDGLAYWPGTEDELFSFFHTTRETELQRYATVIHLHTPEERHYDHSNPVRTESAEHAQEMDARIAHAWRGHPNVHFVDGADDFLQKAQRALALLDREVPACCRATADVSPSPP